MNALLGHERFVNIRDEINYSNRKIDGKELDLCHSGREGCKRWAARRRTGRTPGPQRYHRISDP